MSDWCGAGFDPDAFWRQIPVSYRAAMRGVRERIESDYRASVALAVQQARFNAADPKKLPKPGNILRGGAKRDRPNGPDRDANIGAWAALFRVQAKRAGKRC